MDADIQPRLRLRLDAPVPIVLSRSPRRLGFYLNFEHALALVPASAEFIALADQDDRRPPEKLDTLWRATGSAELV